jgi:hypothetical protein
MAKEGGDLANQINSISKRNAAKYNSMVREGERILDGMGYERRP